ncbi:Uncharacterised protein [uncultured archaeon]|nr:Uncharacterised protein [uncultured archaeon]
MKAQIILFLVFALIGVGMILFGLYRLVYYSRLTKKAKGKIVDIGFGPFPQRDGAGTTRYPIIEFLTENKNKIKFESNVGMKDKNIYGVDYRKMIGQEVEVLYNPNDPNKAEYAKNIFWAKFMFLIWGLIALVIGIIGTINFY